MKFQLLHKAIKGTQVVSLNIVTHTVHIRLLARQIHNRVFSPSLLPLSPLTFAALSPPQPCSSPAPPLPAWRWWRGRHNSSEWNHPNRPSNMKNQADYWWGKSIHHSEQVQKVHEWWNAKNWRVDVYACRSDMSDIASGLLYFRKQHEVY
jgi:hypothetical protein